MEVFKDIVGEDLDSKEYAKQILANLPKGKRFVIKRPIKAEALIEKPSGSFEGKTTRYDLYVN